MCLTNTLLEAALSIKGVSQPFIEQYDYSGLVILTKILNEDEITKLQKMDRYRFNAAGKRNGYLKKSYIKLRIYINMKGEKDQMKIKLSWYANPERELKEITLAESYNYLSIMEIIEDMKLISSYK